MRKVTAVFLLLLIFVGGKAFADTWLVAVLSGNARADAWLIPASGAGEPKALLHEIADIKTDAEYVGYTGNIAFSHFQLTDHFAGYLTDKLLTKILPQVERLRDKGVLGENPEFSFLYAIAGLDAVDGMAKGYNPSDGRQATSIYEGLVDEQFKNHDLPLGALVAAHDGALLLDAVKGQDPAVHMVVYDDTYGEGYLLWNGQVKKQKAAFSSKVPAGGFFQLGYEGADLLNSTNDGAGKLSYLIRNFWKEQNLDYTAEEVQQRYSHSHRNELGGVMSQLIQKGETFLRPELTKTVDGLVHLAKELDYSCPYAKHIPVKIIGFYGETLQADQLVLQGRFASLSNGKLVPELVTGEKLNNALVGAAVRVFKQVMAARYGFE